MKIGKPMPGLRRFFPHNARGARFYNTEDDYPRMAQILKTEGSMADQFSHRTFPSDNVFGIQKDVELENLVRVQYDKGNKVFSNSFCIIPTDDGSRARDMFKITLFSILNSYNITEHVYHEDGGQLRQLMAYNDNTLIIVEIVSVEDNFLERKEIKGCNISVFSSNETLLSGIVISFTSHGFKTVRNLYSNVEENETPIKYAFPDSYDVVIQEKSFERLPFENIYDNYTQDVQEKYERAVKTINESRSGLVVLNGPPGTGKSYLLRALLTDVRERQGIVCIPAVQFLNDVGRMSNVMAENKKSIIILEDVGEILSIDSQLTHATEVSNLLNMTEGFLSFLSNAIFVATFNYELEKVNPALLRPGRCISRIPVGELDYAHAQRLIGEDIKIPKNRDYTLAHVYQIRNAGTYVEDEFTQKKKSAGFI